MIIHGEGGARGGGGVGAGGDGIHIMLDVLRTQIAIEKANLTTKMLDISHLYLGSLSLATSCFSLLKRDPRKLRLPDGISKGEKLPLDMKARMDV